MTGEPPSLMESATESQDSPMAMLLENYLDCYHLERGRIVRGVVVRVFPNSIVVDVGAKCEGIVPEYDLARLSPQERQAIREGDELLVYVVSVDEEINDIVLSLSRAQMAQDWEEARRLLQEGQVIECLVTGCNKGGVIIQMGRLRGFVPGSQLDVPRGTGRSARDGGAGDNRWSSLVNTVIPLKIIEVDQDRNRLILSERAARQELQRKLQADILEKLTTGDICTGTVTNLTSFGAFVDIGGIDGLVHLSELSWQRVSHPQDVVQVGQEVKVYVLSVDKERKRVALSLKQLEPDPWETIEERYQEGQLVEGKITRLTKWGAFARIIGDEAIEGLIHISELDDAPVVSPRDVVQPHQIVTLRVIGVDAARRRLALSLKQVAQGEYLDQDWQMMLAQEQSPPDTTLATVATDRSSERQTRAPDGFAQ